MWRRAGWYLAWTMSSWWLSCRNSDSTRRLSKKTCFAPELDKVERDWKFAPAERGNETPSAATTAGLALPASWALKNAGSFDLPTEVLVPDYGGVSIAEVVVVFSPRVPTVIRVFEKRLFLFGPWGIGGPLLDFALGPTGSGDPSPFQTANYETQFPQSQALDHKPIPYPMLTSGWAGSSPVRLPKT